jgi:pimeloyl-ACP methyl ester carboxylesterase
VLARSDVDAIMNATPDHWHALPFIEACKSGADIYCQKPISVDVTEGRAMLEAARKYTMGPTRVQFQNKDPRGWAEFAAQMAEHDPVGSANTLLGVQKMRPSLWDLVEQMKSIQAPALIITGDEDDPCLEPALLMKRHIPSASLVVLPRAGHTNNLEDPDTFNRHLMDFYLAVLSGRYGLRDPRSLKAGILGFGK